MKFRYIPAGATCVTHKASDAVAYLYTTRRGTPAAITYIGQQSKAWTHYSFATEAARERHVAQVFSGRAAALARKAAEAAERRAWVNPYKVGDLFRRHWGYDQTNINWYEVTAVRGKMMEVREIGQSREYTQHMAGKTVPLPGQYIGEVLRVRAQAGRVKINHYDHAYFAAPKLVAGVATYDADYFSTYA